MQRAHRFRCLCCLVPPLPIHIVLLASLLLVAVYLLLAALPLQAAGDPTNTPQPIGPRLLSATNQATLYISDEEAKNRTLVDAQDDTWRAAVQGATSCSNFQVGVLSESTNVACGATKTGDCINPNTFASGLVISYTLRDMIGTAPLGNSSVWATGQGDGCTPGGTTLQDNAPRPNGLAGCYYNDAFNLRGDTNSPNAVLFTFSQPVNAFGAWFGDLESKAPGTNYYHAGKDGGTGTGGALAYLRLVYEDGTIQQTPITPTLAPAAPWLSTVTPSAVALGSGGQIGLCGGATAATDAIGCGNHTTRWVGFVNTNPNNRVKQMLVVVGDDDHSGAGPSDGPNVQCSGGNDSTCNGGGEFISFIGPTVCIAPDLSLTKRATPDPVLAGSILTYTLVYNNLVAGSATGAITLTDQLPAGVTYLNTVAANPPATLLNNMPQWRIASLPANTTGYLTLTAQVNAALTGLMTNTATIVTPGDLNSSNNQAQVRTFVAQPGIALRKLTNGIVATAPPGPTLNEGATVTWSYQMTNTGNITLTKLTLTDDRIANLVCAEGKLPTQLPPKATFTCTVTGVAGIGQYVNHATVSATPSTGNLPTVTASDLSYYLGIGYGNLVIVKQADPANDQDFGFTTSFANSFTLDDDNDNTLSDRIRFDALVAGATYTVNETGLPHWPLTDLTCTGATVSALQRTATGISVTLAAHETVTCTFTNTGVRPTLTVTKVVINDHGGSAVVGDFPLFVNSQAVSSGVATTLASGSYTISEQGTSTYAATISGDCSPNGQVTLAIGDVKQCTITNDDIAPTLTVEKVVINNDGGTASVADFPLFANQQPLTSGVAQTLSAGAYTIHEQNSQGYTASFSGDCAADGTVTLALAESKHCILTNDDIAPTLTVIKHVINDHGGAASVANFPLFVNDQPVTSGAITALAAGVYTVTEHNQGGYVGLFEGDCSPEGVVILQLGDAKSCTLVNNDLPPTLGALTVQKIVVNDDGGSAVVDDFALFVNQQNVNSAVENLLKPGSYNVSESNLPGYRATLRGDCTADGVVNLNAGDQLRCEIINDDIAPTLTVNKVVLNDDGGTAAVSDFPLFVGGQPVSSGVTTTLAVGEYMVSENNPAGYAATFSGDCTTDGLITLQIGDVKRCTITNNDLPPRLAVLTVHKVVVNDHGGTAAVSDFPLLVNDQPIQSGLDNLLAPGSYTIREQNLPGYAATFSSDCAADGTITLEAGEVKSCTLTNDDIAPTLTVNKIVINDNGGMAPASAFPLLIDQTVVSNGAVNALVAGAYTVHEINKAAYAATLSGDCTADGTVILQIGDVKSCTITNDDLPPTQGALTIRKIVVNDQGGTAVASDFTLLLNNQPVLNGAANLLGPGDYQVSEQNQTGYAATFSGDCRADGAVTVQAGEDKSCIITNDDIAPTLTVHKVVVNNDGGIASSADFPLLVDDLRVSNDAATPLSVGTYRVHENNLLGYVATLSGDCAPDGTVTLNIGENKQCTITNDDLAPSQAILTVRKIVENRYGGQAQVSDFPLTVNGQPVLSDVAVQVAPGSYTVHEQNLPGYAASFGGDCTADGLITLQADEHRTCVLTNYDLAPTLIVQKIVINDDGGTAQVIDFPLQVNQQTVTSGMSNTLPAGVYTVTERNLPGYHVTFGGDCAAGGAVQLGLGVTRFCTLTNNDFFASLGDRVWYDRNIDGLQDVDEPGIAGITVKLYDQTGRLIATTITDTDGHYLFSKLLPGEYRVAFDKSQDYVFTALSNGVDNMDSNANPDSGQSEPITLQPSEHNLTIDAGLYQLAALGNFVWNDLDQDGIQDPNEPGIGGLLVTLYDSNQTVVGVTHTTSSGFYGFSDLAPGAYFIKIELPPEYRFTSPDRGDDASDSDIDPQTGQSSPVQLDPDAINLTLDAGVLAYPLLSLEKRVSQTTVEVNPHTPTVVTYTLAYANRGPVPAANVVITETVSLSATFNAPGSTPGWNCLDGAGPGTQCRLNLGLLPPQATGSVIFGVNLMGEVKQPTSLVNVAQLGDDGTNNAQGTQPAQVRSNAALAIHAPTGLSSDPEPVVLPNQLYLPGINR